MRQKDCTRKLVSCPVVPLHYTRSLANNVSRQFNYASVTSQWCYCYCPIITWFYKCRQGVLKSVSSTASTSLLFIWPLEVQPQGCVVGVIFLSRGARRGHCPYRQLFIWKTSDRKQSGPLIDAWLQQLPNFRFLFPTSAISSLGLLTLTALLESASHGKPAPALVHRHSYWKTVPGLGRKASACFPWRYWSLLEANKQLNSQVYDATACLQVTCLECT